MVLRQRETSEIELPLRSGDRMTREEFHRAYCEMPANYRAELIGGIVFEPSPVSYGHGMGQVRLGSLLDEYAGETPGTQVADNVSLMLSSEDEVQPDLILRVLPGAGGRSYETDDHFLCGAPELVAEVAYSSRAIDLHLKRERYALAGVVEYLVVCLRPKRIYWFDLRNEMIFEPDRKGVFKSVVFPGLWIHGDGLLDLDYQLTRKTLRRGLRTAEHKKFAKALAQRLT